jgi:hypothetical protein
MISCEATSFGSASRTTTSPSLPSVSVPFSSSSKARYALSSVMDRRARSTGIACSAPSTFPPLVRRLTASPIERSGLIGGTGLSLCSPNRIPHRRLRRGDQCGWIARDRGIYRGAYPPSTRREEQKRTPLPPTPRCGRADPRRRPDSVRPCVGGPCAACPPGPSLRRPGANLSRCPRCHAFTPANQTSELR